MSAQNRRFAVLTLADGVSSCKEAKKGAKVASESITNLFIDKAVYFMDFEKKKTAKLAILHMMYELKKRAEQDKMDVDDYSSTVASVLIDKKRRKMMYFNLGDSIIITVENKKCSILAKPMDSSDGCVVTTTEGAELSVDTGIVSCTDSVLICSDGAWGSMFDRGKLRYDVREMITNGQYDKLSEFIKSHKHFDDSTFISVDLKKMCGRKIG
jgi:serine/threonine protein phosphatase PrpC